MGEFYVYIHYKADTMEPFYVGKGKGERAWVTRRRNIYWRSVAEKHGFTVRIWRKNLTETEAFSEESRKIRSFTAKGIKLTNMTEGGEGSSGPSKNPKIASARDKRKQEILEFRMSFGRFPSHAVCAERKLNNSLNGYCQPHHDTYDKEFSETCRNLGYASGALPVLRAEAAERRRTEVREFVKKHGRLPQQRGLFERPLYTFIQRHSRPGYPWFDADFDKEMRALGYGSNQGKRLKEKV